MSKIYAIEQLSYEYNDEYYEYKGTQNLQKLYKTFEAAKKAKDQLLIKKVRDKDFDSCCSRDENQNPFYSRVHDGKVFGLTGERYDFTLAKNLTDEQLLEIASQAGLGKNLCITEYEVSEE